MFNQNFVGLNSNVLFKVALMDYYEGLFQYILRVFGLTLIGQKFELRKLLKVIENILLR